MLGLWLLLGASPFTARSGAQVGAPAEPASAAQATGRMHFVAAMEHYRERRYREAIHEFQLSIAAVPSADVWFNIGRAHEQLGEFPLAVLHYRLYLRDRVDAPDAAEVKQRIAELEQHARDAGRSGPERTAPQSGMLAIEAGEPGALVLLDGEKLGLSPIERMLRVEPGRHRLEVSRPDHIPYRAELEVEPGALSIAFVELRPLAHAPAADAARLWTWVAAGATAGALLASGALGLVALDRRSAGEWREARQLAVASDVALGAGLGLALGALLLYYVEEGPDESPPRAQ